MKERAIKALMVEPDRNPRVAYLNPTMRGFCQAVSIGTDEFCNVKAKHIEKNIYIIFNAEIFLTVIDANRKIGKDIIAGVFYVIATDSKYHPISLTDSEIQKYMVKFWEPKCFTDLELVEHNLDTMFKQLEEFE